MGRRKPALEKGQRRPRPSSVLRVRFAAFGEGLGTFDVVLVFDIGQRAERVAAAIAYPEYY